MIFFASSKLRVVVPTLALLLLVGISVLLPTDVYAATCDKNETIILECGSGQNGIWSILLIIINVLSAGVGILAVGGIVYAALLWTTAEDKADQLNKAKTIITDVVIGVVVYALIYSGTQFLIPGGAFDRTSTVASVTNTTSSELPKDDGINNGGGSGGGSSAATQDKLSAKNSFKPSQVLIVGDSITAFPGNPVNQGNKGWWEYLLDGKKGTFKFKAEGGAGYVHESGHTSSTFTDWIPSVGSMNPKVVVIAGGLNDSNSPTASSGIKSYYDKLAKALKTNNVNPKNVYAFVPRPKGSAENIVPLVKSNVTRIGANYVNVGTYTETFDKLHPNSASAKIIADNFAARSNFDERLVSQDAVIGGTVTAADIKTVKNLRDASTTNNVLKSGALYRSAQLSHLDSANSKKLSALLGSGSTIIDLRTDASRATDPDTPVPGTKKSNIPIEGILDTEPMVTDSVRRSQLAKALRTAGSASGAVLVHCVAGKDRTGWTVAMIMYVNGASDQQVMTEYLKSNEAIPGGVKPEWLTNGVREARQRHGTINGYLQSIGLSKADINKLKTKFGA